MAAIPEGSDRGGAEDDVGGVNSEGKRQGAILPDFLRFCRITIATPFARPGFFRSPVCGIRRYPRWIEKLAWEWAGRRGDPNKEGSIRLFQGRRQMSSTS